MLSGLMSRWTMPRACACASPAQTCIMMSTMRFERTSALPARARSRSVDAVEELHHDVEQAVGLLSEVEDARDVRMIEPARRERLGVEAPAEVDVVSGRTRAAPSRRRACGARDGVPCRLHPSFRRRPATRCGACRRRARDRSASRAAPGAGAGSPASSAWCSSLMKRGVGRRAVPARGSVGVSLRANARGDSRTTFAGARRSPAATAGWTAGSSAGSMVTSNPTATCSTVGTRSDSASSSGEEREAEREAVLGGGPVGSAMRRTARSTSACRPRAGASTCPSAPTRGAPTPLRSRGRPPRGSHGRIPRPGPRRGREGVRPPHIHAFIPAARGQGGARRRCYARSRHRACRRLALRSRLGERATLRKRGACVEDDCGRTGIAGPADFASAHGSEAAPCRRALGRDLGNVVAPLAIERATEEERVRHRRPSRARPRRRSNAIALAFG